MPLSRRFLPKVLLIRCALDYFSNWIKAYPPISTVGIGMSYGEEAFNKVIKSFSLTWPASMQIYWNKKKAFA